MRFAMLGFTVLALICSCGRKTQNEKPVIKAYNYKAPLDNHDLINRLQDSATQYGNARAYNELASYYELENWNAELLYYGMIMANKYNNPRGYYHVYCGLTSPRTGETLEQLDKRTRSLALYYLLKSYELGEKESAKYQIERIFGEGKPIPKASFYLQEFVKAEEGQ